MEMVILIAFAAVLYFVIIKTNKKSKIKEEQAKNILSTIKAFNMNLVSIREVAQICNTNELYVIKILSKLISTANKLPTNKRSNSAEDEKYRFLRNANINKYAMVINLDPNATEIHTKLGDFVGSIFGSGNKQNPQPTQPQNIIYNVNQNQTTVNQNRTTVNNIIVNQL